MDVAEVFELIYMQIVGTIKYTLSPRAEDLQHFCPAVLWLLPSAFCLQMTDSYPARAGVSKEQRVGSEVHCSSQHEWLESNASEGSSAWQHNCLHSHAVSQINVLLSELACLENNLVKKMNFLIHLTAWPKSSCIGTATGVAHCNMRHV